MSLNVTASDIGADAIVTSGQTYGRHNPSGPFYYTNSTSSTVGASGSAKSATIGFSLSRYSNSFGSYVRPYSRTCKFYIRY